MQVYATVLSTQRIGVFVTGFVRARAAMPASPPTASSTSWCAPAASIPAAAPFREISITRGGRNVASVDLYRFLLQGSLPQIRLQEGDTIVVARQRAMIGADGAVRNNYLFESAARPSLTGAS